jgi:alpha-L-arabinofuranosidase
VVRDRRAPPAGRYRKNCHRCSVKPQATAIVLTAEDFEANNSFNQPQLVALQTTTIDLPRAEFSHEFPARSLTILRIDAD